MIGGMNFFFIFLHKEFLWYLIRISGLVDHCLFLWGALSFLVLWVLSRIDRPLITPLKSPVFETVVLK